MRIKILKADEYLLQFLLFMVLFLTSGFVVTNDLMSSSVTIGLWVMVLTILLLQQRKLKPDMIFVFIIIAGSFLISDIFNSEPIINTFKCLFSFVTVFFLVNRYDPERIKNSYIEIMYLISWISLILFALFTILPSLSNINVVINAAGNAYSNLYIYTHSSLLQRNQSMFWEPGAFQTFVNIALLFEILKDNTNIKKIFIFTIAVITTFSTTGYIALALCFLLLLIKNNRRDRKNKQLRRAIILFVFIAAILIVYNYDLFFDRSKNSVFGKIVNFFENDQIANNTMSSSTIRYYSFVKSIEAFFRKPIFGWGYEGLSIELFPYTHGMNTCTFINFLSVYGIFYGIPMLVGFILLSKEKKQRWYISLLVFTIFFICTISENFVNNAFFIMLSLMGYKTNFGEVKKENSLTLSNSKVNNGYSIN